MWDKREAVPIMSCTLNPSPHHLSIESKKHRGYVASIAGRTYRCLVGKKGFQLAKDKAEGDGCTPVGVFPLRQLFYRPDVYGTGDLVTSLETQVIQPFFGWCDASSHPDYNRLVDLRLFEKDISHEKMWREDPLYNIVIAIGYNDDPVIKGKGSAIFIHLAREGYRGTRGCIALSESDMREVITYLSPGSMIVIEGETPSPSLQS